MYTCANNMIEYDLVVERGKTGEDRSNFPFVQKWRNHFCFWAPAKGGGVKPRERRKMPTGGPPQRYPQRRSQKND